MQSIFFYILMCLILSISVFLVIKHIFKINNNKLLFLFILYLIGLISLTILPKMYFIDGRIVFKNEGFKFLNLIPFRIFYDTIIEIKKGNIYYLVFSLIGNIIMFIPIGIILPILFNCNYKKTIFIGFLISLFIEMTQLIFLNRETDIDDLILNTVGVMIGLVILKYLSNVCYEKRK